MLPKGFKDKLLEIVKNESEELIGEWLKYFEDNDTKDEQYRYYEDFLGFFEECIEDNLDPKSDSAKAMMHFLLKIKDLIGEEEFFNFNDSVYTCYLKFPIFNILAKENLFIPENIIPITAFFESMTSKIILDYIAKTKEHQEASTKELVAREAPMSEIWDGILMVSIVGTLDSQRVLDIIDKVLKKLEKNRLKHVVIDISAIFDINTEVASQIMKLNRAIHFMGAKAYITGITSNITKSLTHLDISFGDIKTYQATKFAVSEIIKNQRENQFE